MFVVNESIGFLLGMSAKKVTHHFARAMKNEGIDFGHGGWIVLSRLWEEDGLSQQEISDRAGVAKPNISNYCDMLERHNYIVRVTDAEDKRSFRCYLTNQAKALRQPCTALAQQTLEDCLSALSAEERSQLRQLLKKIHN